MFVTGFMGSPRKNGNTSFLLNGLLNELRISGAETHMVHVPDLSIHPCTGCGICERKGACHFNDDMQQIVFPLFRKSDIIIIASPIYFYNTPAELKALIDRSQTLWARKFKLRLTDPDEHDRKGFLLAVGATRGKDLFDGIHLTMKYFFKGISTEFTGQLTYNRIEEPGEIKKHPTVLEDIKKSADSLVSSVSVSKPGLFFLCRDNSLTSQMAAAFAQILSDNRVRVLSAGIRPAVSVHPLLSSLMAEKGIDLAYRQPQSIAEAMPFYFKPDVAVIIGHGEDTAIHVPGARCITWPITEPDELTHERLATYRDMIEEKVRSLLDMSFSDVFIKS